MVVPNQTELDPEQHINGNEKIKLIKCILIKRYWLSHWSCCNQWWTDTLTHWSSGVNFPVRAFNDSCATTPPRNAHRGAKQPWAVNARYCRRSLSIFSTWSQTISNTSRQINNPGQRSPSNLNAAGGATAVCHVRKNRYHTRFTRTHSINWGTM